MQRLPLPAREGELSLTDNGDAPCASMIGADSIIAAKIGGDASALSTVSTAHWHRRASSPAGDGDGKAKLNHFGPFIGGCLRRSRS